MKERKKILVCIDWFLPAYKAGGPIQSITNLINHTKADFEYYVATSNLDLGEPLDITPQFLNVWQKKDGYNVVYLDAKHQTLSYYKQLFLMESFDVVYMNSLFSKKFTLLPLLLFRNKPIRKVLAPRGMLGEGALEIKATKKKLFLNVFKFFNMPKKVVWHATAQSEAKEIMSHFGEKCKVFIAPNLSAKKRLGFDLKKKQSNQLNVFFLSRISIKKNLLGALDYLSYINVSQKIVFSIIGPVEDSVYWQKCCQKIEILPKNIHVEVLGAVPNHEISIILKKQHILLLPTQHENFGHVIMESWQSGCPVVISDQTPWRNLSDNLLGYDISLDDGNEFVNAIMKFSKMDNVTYNKWSNSSIAYAKDFTENPKLIEQNKALFLNTTKQ